MWLGYLRSESEVSVLFIGTCFFPEIVYEITLDPRPASRSHTGDVETDHPLEWASVVLCGVFVIAYGVRAAASAAVNRSL